MYRKTILFLGFLTAIGFTAIAALAQVPPHTPGSICFTPDFWCWIDPPGQPGMACYCYDTSGRAVTGVLN